MATIEKLFVQIFERKNRIVEQVKNQTDLYSQHLASKLLIDGITPPPWLWNPNCKSEFSDPKELKKEDLISELLLPHPRPADPYSGGHCFPYSKPVDIGDNGEMSERLYVENHASSGGINSGGRLTTASDCHDDDVGRVLNCVPELDSSATSPQGQTETRTSNIYNAPDMSFARIQRSKSRQKALELRKTSEAAAKTKSHLSDKNATGVCPDVNKTSTFASQHLGQGNELLELANYSNTISNHSAARRAIGECMSKEKDANTYCGRVTRSRSSCNLSRHDHTSLEPGNSSGVGEEDGGRMIMSQSTCIEGSSKPVHLSSTASQRVTWSKTSASKKSPFVDSLSRSKGFHRQNVSDIEVIPNCPDNSAIVNQEIKDDYVNETELISDGPVEVKTPCSVSNLDAAVPNVGLEDFVSKPPSDCSMLVKPKTLDFDDMEKCSLNEVTCPMLEKERVEKPLEKLCCTSVKCAASVDKITYNISFRKSFEEQSMDQEVSNKAAEACRDSVDECFLVDKEVSKSTMNKNVEDNVDAVQEIRHSPQDADIVLSNVGECLDVEMHQKMKVHLMDGVESSRKLQVEWFERGHEGRDRSETTPLSDKHQQLGPLLVSSLTKQSTVDHAFQLRKVEMKDSSSSILDVRRQYNVEHNQDLMCLENQLDKGDMSGLACTERTLPEKKSHVEEDGFLECGLAGSLHHDEKNFGSSKISELELLEKSLMQGRRLRSATENSYPQFKRRKIECQQTSSLSASPSFRVKKIHGIEEGNTTNRYLKSVGDDLGSTLQLQCLPVSLEVDALQSNADKSPDVEFHQKVIPHLTRGIEPSPDLQLEQDELDMEEINQSTNNPLTLKHRQMGPSVISSLSKEASGDSQGCFVASDGPEDTTSFILDVRMLADEQNYKKMLHSEHNIDMESKNDMIHIERRFLETKPQLKEDGSFSCCSVASPQDNQLGSIAADQTKPEFEGFIVDAEENGQQHIIGDAFTFETLDLPSTAIERAIVLERLCKSTSTPDLYQSVPNGFLEQKDLRTFNLNRDGVKLLRASYSYLDEVKCAFQGLSYSDSVPSADAHFGLASKKPPMSPVGKLWDHISSNSSSSEKQRSLNPELICFPIEEDPSISEENENRDEVAKMTQENICSSLMNCGAKREPLAEITERRRNPPPSVSAAERFPDRSSLDSVNTEISFTGTCSRVKQKLGNCDGNKRRSKNEPKVNNTLSLSINCNKKANVSLNNRVNKPKLSGKTSLRKGGQSLSEREHKRNNIVSNINSFVPLVQQKQVTTVGTGKRDIKVKALDAAEAAKRLEEKRQNERKKKKEALKLERARIEQENLRQMELKKKKKEEEQKKKDADMAERKRLKEEEERKEKERKRKRLEEARQQQREQEKRLRVGKVVKEVPFGATDEKVISQTEPNDDLGKHQKMEKEKADSNIVKRPPSIGTLTNSDREGALDDREAFVHSSDTWEPTNVLSKTPENDNLMAKTSQEKSYEISPYQCSDDEDEEEDELPTKKFIPSWASKNSVALVLSSQQKLDPNMIFPPESFCSMDEVLQPRKLQQK